MEDLTKDVSKEQLVENLANLAWDCQSGWIANRSNDEAVENWPEDRLRMTSNNIITMLTKPEGEDE